MLDSELSDDFLVEHADRLAAEAVVLVRELGLLPMLGMAGEAVQIGSSVMGLMVWRDLDFVVHSPGLPSSQAFESLKPLLEKPGLRALEYLNDHGPDLERPEDSRHYFVARYERTPGVVWKLDFTFWTAVGRHDHESYGRSILERLTPENRLAILRIKYLWHERPSYPYQVGGYEVYDAVLNGRVHTSQEFSAYLRARGLPTD